MSLETVHSNLHEIEKMSIRRMKFINYNEMFTFYNLSML